jgi:3-hydroxymyristoyl/3-hydroxydecanoyl-(acyl carrier protein) dehydratase
MREDIAGALKSIEQGEEPDTLKACFCFDSGLAVFEGHFPGMPLVPGIMQIEMARYAVESHTGRQFRISLITRAKFARPVVPDEIIDMQAALSREEGTLKVRAQSRVDGELAASVSMVLVERN